MSFEPIAWVNDEILITPARLRHMETQYEEAIDETAGPMRTDTTEPLTAEKLATEPTGAEARIYFNTDTGQLWGYDGASWKELGE